MKFLQTAVLSTIFMGYAITGSVVVDRDQLRDAIDKSDFVTVKKLCGQDFHSCYEEIGQVIATKPFNFIINLIKQIDRVDGFTLAKLYENGTGATIQAVLEKINFPSYDWIVAASSSELMCSPEKYVELLQKIKAFEEKELAIQSGIGDLFNKSRTKCIAPLLAALETETSIGRQLKDVAVLAVFQEGAAHNDESVKLFYDRPVITPTVYAAGLLAAAKKGLMDPVFRWLFSKADRGDLQKVQLMEGQSAKLRRAIRNSLSSAEESGTRLGGIAKKVEAVKETVPILPGDVGGIIGSYMTEYEE